MKIFYNAKWMLLFFTIIAMLFTLGSMAAAKKSNAGKPLPQLSDNYVVGGITYNQDIGEAFNKKAMLNAFQQNSQSTILLSPTGDGQHEGYALYYSGKTDTGLQIVEGKNFSKNDFLEGKDCILVNALLKDDCVKKKDKWYFDYNNKQLEVNGFFSGKDKYGNKLRDFYVCYTAQCLGKDLYTTYVYDSQGMPMDDFADIKQMIEDRYQGVVIEAVANDSTDAIEYIGQADNAAEMIRLWFLAAFFVILNSFSVCRNWIESKKVEIAIRRMVGAGRRQINAWIYKSFCSILLVSFLLGVLLSKAFLTFTRILPVYDSTLLMFGGQLNLEGIFGGAILLFAIGSLVIEITLRQTRRKELAEIMK